MGKIVRIPLTIRRPSAVKGCRAERWLLPGRAVQWRIPPSGRSSPSEARQFRHVSEPKIEKQGRPSGRWETIGACEHKRTDAPPRWPQSRTSTGRRLWRAGRANRGGCWAPPAQRGVGLLAALDNTECRGRRPGCRFIGRRSAPQRVDRYLRCGHSNGNAANPSCATAGRQPANHWG